MSIAVEIRDRIEGLKERLQFAVATEATATEAQIRKELQILELAMRGLYTGAL